MNNGFSLIEVVVAVLILAVAIIPISGLITHDAQSSIILANSIFAQQKARFILDTLLDQVSFDELEIGSPAILTGTSAERFGQQLFPGNAGDAGQQLCEGVFENKGWLFQASMEVKEIPDTQISFSTYKNPDIFASWNQSASQPLSLIKKSEVDEAAGNPSYMQIHKSVYVHDEWARQSDTFSAEDFNQSGESPCLIKALILRIRWSNKTKAKPLSDEHPAGFWLVTHKARLKTG